MVEGSGLENQRTRKCSVGSNPTPSAKLLRLNTANRPQRDSFAAMCVNVNNGK